MQKTGCNLKSVCGSVIFSWSFLLFPGCRCSYWNVKDYFSDMLQLNMWKREQFLTVVRN